MRRWFLTYLLAVLLVGSVSATTDQKISKQTVYDFSLVDLNGKTVPLSSYKGKVMLIVNLASQSSYREQISALNDLQNTYSAQGLVVLGIPSADFGGKELKDAMAVRQYYMDKVHIAFPVFAPARTQGVETIPLYSFLCDPKLSVPGGKLHWSFTKFLIDRDGQPLARYEVSEDPQDASFHLVVESALDGKLRKQLDQKRDDSGIGQKDAESPDLR